MVKVFKKTDFKYKSRLVNKRIDILFKCGNINIWK